LTPKTVAQSEIEARLVKRMAIAFWKSERAERIEVALFDAAPRLRPPQAGFAWEEADPLTTFDLKRFNAVRGYQAQQGRELSRCLKELRQLRREPLAVCTDEPEATSQKEPERPPEPANDDAHRTDSDALFAVVDLPPKAPVASSGAPGEPDRARLADAEQALASWAEARLRRLRAEQGPGADPVSVSHAAGG
jgi:hypothetical protein